MAGLPEEGRLLIAGDASNRNCDAADIRVRADSGRGHDAREHRAWDVEQREELVIPIARANVEEQRAARVRRIGDMSFAVRQVPDEPGVDGAERKLAAHRAFA